MPGLSLDKGNRAITIATTGHANCHQPLIKLNAGINISQATSYDSAQSGKTVLVQSSQTHGQSTDVINKQHPNNVLVYQQHTRHYESISNLYQHGTDG
jgi:hypothetical protein